MWWINISIVKNYLLVISDFFIKIINKTVYCHFFILSLDLNIIS